MTTEFADAAEAQCDALALAPAIVYVPHPIQNRTTDELHALANGAFAEVMAALQGSAQNTSQ